MVAHAPEAAAAGTTEYVYWQPWDVTTRSASSAVAAGRAHALPARRPARPNNNSGWLINTNVDSYMVGRVSNVAIPFGGGGLLHRLADHRPQARQEQGETFLTRELPGHMEAQVQQRQTVATVSPVCRCPAPRRSTWPRGTPVLQRRRPSYSGCRPSPCPASTRASRCR